MEKVNVASTGIAAATDRGLNSGAATLKLLDNDDNLAWVDFSEEAESGCGAVEFEFVDVEGESVARAPDGFHGSAVGSRGLPKTNGLAKGFSESRRPLEFPAADGCGGCAWCTGGGERMPNGGAEWPNDDAC